MSTTLTIQVPTELNVLGNTTIGIINDILGGKGYMEVIGNAAPVLFSEGTKIAAIKEELKDPQAILLGCMVIGGFIAKFVANKAAAKAAAALAAGTAAQA